MPHGQRAILQLEVLEDRCTPSSVTLVSKPAFPLFVPDDTSMAYADLNRDGQLDIIVNFGVRVPAAGTSEPFKGLVWFENSGGPNPAFTPHVIDGNTGPDLTINPIGVGDINGDGNPDIISAVETQIRKSQPFAVTSTFAITWWENNGAPIPTFTPHFLAGRDGSPVSLVMADINGDRRADVISTFDFLDKGPPIWPVCITCTSPFPRWERFIVWYENPGNKEAWPVHTIAQFPGDFMGQFRPGASVGDFNGDGHPDVVAGDFDNNLTWWANPGIQGSDWTPHTIAKSTYRAPTTVGDLDGDRRVDVVSVEGGNVIWYENTGGVIPTFTRHQFTINGAEFRGNSLALADFNNDGRLDLLYSWGQPGWLENLPGAVSLTTSNKAPPALAPGQTSDLLRIDVTNGLAANSLALRSLALLFETSEGVGLTNREAAGLFASFSIFRDNGSGQFDAADTLVTQLTSLSLDSGLQNVSLNPGDANTKIAPGTTATFFVVVQRKSGIGPILPQQFRVTNMASAAILADWDSGDPFSLENVLNISSSWVWVS